MIVKERKAQPSGCLMTACCCECSLRQAACAILVFDATILVLQFLVAIIWTATLKSVDGVPPTNLDSFKVLAWIIVLSPALRTFSGCASAGSHFKRKRLRLVHFICRVVADGFDVLFSFISFALYFNALNLVFFAALFALGI